ncbi:hypothetical protein [Streptomyces sp. SudanB5_2050]|uniref:hypothetical protein n=1 Tax=Streptomyces sp. SudanB5_2050 TaxID=3035274 RepID=UPI0036DE658D
MPSSGLRRENPGLATTDQPAWAIGLSTDVPPEILEDLTFNLSLATDHRAAESRSETSMVAPTPPGASASTPQRGALGGGRG